MSKERDILKSLLLKEELEVLNQLKSKLLSEEQFTDEVAKVLSNAIKRSQKTDPQLERSLEKPIKKGVLRAFSESKQTIIDALLPIMGQLIRKTVANSIKQFVSDINRTLEVGFSSKALKWRWQALRTGKSFAEIVFQKTIRYQVNEIFLINRENGLLIEHAGTEGFLKDSNAISAMLTAIQSFIGDSFESNDAHLQSVEIKNQNFIIATGPKVYLAAVVRGNPTERLKQRFQEIIENIHAEYSEVLRQEESYQNNLELNDYLRGNLVTKSLSDKQKEVNTLPWILVLVAIVIGMTYWSYSRNQSLKNIWQKSATIDGLYVQKIERKDGSFMLYGLLDPLADTSELSDDTVVFVTKPYASLDEAIIRKRINLALSHYQMVQSHFNNGLLTLTGEINYEDSQLLLTRLYSINGVNHIDDGALVKTNPPTVQREEDLSPFFDQINNAFIRIPDIKNQALIEARLGFIIKNLQLLEEKGVKMELTLIGTSDCSGLLSDDYSLKRANLVKEIIGASLKENDFINTTVKKCTVTNQTNNKSLLGVKFNLKGL